MRNPFRRKEVDQYQWTELATYNAECARGIAHTPEWDRVMAEQQRRFNESSTWPRSLAEAHDKPWMRPWESTGA